MLSEEQIKFLNDLTDMTKTKDPLWSHVEHMIEIIDSLESENSELKNKLCSAITERDLVVQGLKDYNTRLREALKFYAEEFNYEPEIPELVIPVTWDSGKKARE